ncbi:hypothetical protein [Streptomyces sp. NPDC006638]|uniref:hypothetical protein n=1 Tax=Streptomyces sp. NPDC006638 TaxID=3157183 RepID=UPI0033ABF6C2
MSEPPPCLSDLLDRLGDVSMDVLDAGAREGWSPGNVGDAMHVIDILVSAAAQYGGPLAAVLEPLPALTVAARRVLRDPLPAAPHPRSYAARAEKEDGTAQFRAWRDARRHQALAEPCEVTMQRAVAHRAEATAFQARREGREATAIALQARHDLNALLPDDS